jgi:tetratricopeptide (TPR) repeat protein
MLKAQNIAIPVASTYSGDAEPATDPNEAEIIPVQGLGTVELAAIKAYNQGVSASAPNEKISAYAEAVKLLPAFYEGWFNLAVAHTQAKDAAKAEEAYLKAEALRADAPEVKRNLGRIYLALKRTDDAENCFQAAVKVLPNDAGARNDLGEALRSAGQTDLAEAEYKKAIALKPEYDAAHYNLGLLYAGANRAPEAAACFRKYLECAPNAGDADDVRKWIKELEGGSQKQ